MGIVPESAAPQEAKGALDPPWANDERGRLRSEAPKKASPYEDAEHERQERQLMRAIQKWGDQDRSEEETDMLLLGSKSFVSSSSGLLRGKKRQHYYEEKEQRYIDEMSREKAAAAAAAAEAAEAEAGAGANAKSAATGEAANSEAKKEKK